MKLPPDVERPYKEGIKIMLTAFKGNGYFFKDASLRLASYSMLHLMTAFFNARCSSESCVDPFLFDPFYSECLRRRFELSCFALNIIPNRGSRAYTLHNNYPNKRKEFLGEVNRTAKTPECRRLLLDLPELLAKEQLTFQRSINQLREDGESKLADQCEVNLLHVQLP